MICFRKTHAVVIAAAATFGLAASEKLVAESPDTTAPNITYTATGTFATPQLSGADVFKLAGEPFSIMVVVNSATPPTTHGSNWAKYTDLKMTGTVSSGLEPTPITIKSGLTSLELAIGNPKYDVFTMFAPVDILNGTQINITGTIELPPGTLTKPLAHPFASVALGPCTQPVPPGPCVDTVLYTDPATGQSTTLGIASGTVKGTIPSGSVNATEPASVQLHVDGTQIITAHADGTKSVRAIGSSPVDLGDSSDKVALQFYASGVRDGSEIRVQIAGHDVPVLYAGPADHFAGLDEVSVAVPRSMAGSGNVDVELTVDGRSASPVHIQIQ